MMQEAHIIVKGRVQGVFFRKTCQECAKELGLRGSVKNLSDGSVEIFAQGSEEKIKELIPFVKKRMSSEAFITALQCQYQEIEQALKDFIIDY